MTTELIIRPGRSFKPLSVVKIPMAGTESINVQSTEKTSIVSNSTASPTGDYYFDSYSHYGIHEEMLKDQVRTVSYRNAIYRSRQLFEGKVVLDVGCGTGILSMFAASAGARLVIGVDMSTMVETARKIVAVNGFSDKIVLLRGKMEEVVLPVAKVDIIISEWMGYFLLYESMLDTVLWARDRYLAPGGLLFPDRATMFVAGIEDAEYKAGKLDWWQDVYGFDMGCIRDEVIKEPLVDVVEAKAVMTSDASIKEIDISSVSVADLAFSSEFTIKVTRAEWMHALVVWFSVAFPNGNPSAPRGVHFSTSPYDRSTHWKQVVLYLEHDLEALEADLIIGSIDCRPNVHNRRNLDISITYSLVRNGAVIEGPYAQGYIMG